MPETKAQVTFCDVSVAHVQVTLQQAIVKSAPSDDNLQIALVLAGKRRFMDRPKTEALQKTLARMQKNAMPTAGAASRVRIHSSHLHMLLAAPSQGVSS